MEIKDNDFVELEFDIYANGKLVDTTDEKKGKENKLEIKQYGPRQIIIGKAFVFNTLDNHIKENPIEKEYTLELEPENAYGKRTKDLIRTFPKSTFDEHKLRAVVGMTYDFNGMYGTVKSVTGGRVMVDFNNPLAGKDIKITYKVNKKIDDIKQKLDLVLDAILKIPKDMYEVETKDKSVKVMVPEQLVSVKDM